MVVLGTKNPDKLRELRSLLREEPVRVLSLQDFPRCAEPVENGKTFAANAEKKARQYSRCTRTLTLADGSGLVVPALNGRPGVYSARFAGKNCTYQDNNQKLLKLLSGVPPSKRNAKFVCVIAVYDNGKFVRTVRGECAGSIAAEEKGRKGFGYDPVFIPRGFSKTFAELSRTEKNKISHRAKALKAAKRAIVGYLRRPAAFFRSAAGARSR